MSKIAYISSYFWPEDIGSARFSKEFAEFLAAQGHELTVYSTRPNYPWPEMFVAWAEGSRDEEQAFGLRIKRAPFSPGAASGFASRLQNDLRFAWHVVRQAFSKESEGTTHVVAYVPGIIGALAGWLYAVICGAQFSLIIHDIESGLARALGLMRMKLGLILLRSLERFVFNRSNGVIVLSEGMKSELRDIGCTRPISVLSIWAKPLPFKPIPEKSHVTIGYSGNFGRKQNLDQLLPIIVQLDRNYPEVKVILRGDGSEKERIQNEIKRLNVRNVSLAPLASEELLVDALQEIDLHLVPQAQNVANYALPSKLITLMAAGRPFICIAEADTALEHLAQQSGGGLSFQPGSDNDIIAAIVELARDKDRMRSMGEKGRAFVMSEMGADKLKRLYVEALDISSPVPDHGAAQTI